MTDPTLTEQLTLLESGDVEVVGRMPWSSNATFLVDIRNGSGTHRAIYKPIRGERPLWDFEPGLHRRELAAYLLSEALGMGFVPPTVIRQGPFGEGSLQWFVEADHEEHYFTIYEQKPQLHDQLRAIAAFDVVANNTDRKSGHCLLHNNRVWGIDHGLCFSTDFKLRTVIWDFAGDPLDEPLIDQIRPLASSVPLDVATLLDDDEVAAIRKRAQLLVDLGCFPVDDTGRRYPWPLI